MSAKPLHQLVLQIRGKVQLVVNPATGETAPYVYQRVAKGLGNIQRPGRHDLQLRRHVPFVDNPTQARLRGRRRIAAAVAAWHNLTEGERQGYRERAMFKHMTGFNLFIKLYCEQHPLSEFA
jgi:hypothetical protein